MGQTSTKGLLLCVGIIVTCIVVALGLYIYRNTGKLPLFTGNYN